MVMLGIIMAGTHQGTVYRQDVVRGDDFPPTTTTANANDRQPISQGNMDTEDEMKEYPILFSAPMVRAILDGHKTMTRRVIKHTPDDGCPYHQNGISIACPYGHPGDRPWVRETWATSKSLDHAAPSMLAPGAPIEYQADRCLTMAGGMLPDRGKWRPSIFMMPWMSRLTLEITGVKVERVQDISPADCRAEGVGICLNDIGARYAFGQLWNQINEKRGFGWDVNPWVWVVQFRRFS